MVTFFLGIHIIGSAVFVLYVLAALYSIFTAKGNYSYMKRGAIGIGAHQCISGLALGVLSPNVTVAVACVRGLFLLGVLAVLMTAVSRRFAYAGIDAAS